MTIKEAIDLFKLKEPFTKEQLTQAYKGLAKLYHPDLYISKSEDEVRKAEEKFKEINSANKLLLERFKDNNEFYGIKQTLRERVKKEIKAYEEFFDINDLPSNLHIFATCLFDSIKYYIQVYSSEIDFMDKVNKDEISKIWKIFLENVEEAHKNFFKSIANAYKVPEDYKVNIEFASNTRILWLQMVEFFKDYKNHRLEYVDNKIKEVTEEQAKSNGQLYLKIKSIINAADTEIKNNISKLSLKDIDDEIDKLKEKIKKFESQYVRYTNLLERLKKLEAFKDAEIFQLTNMFESKMLTDEFEQLLNGLEKIVVDNEVKLCVDKLEEVLLNKYNLALSKLKPSKDIEQIRKIYKTMYDISYIFESALNGKVKLEELANLESITFIDFYADATIIEKIKFSTFGQGTFDELEEIWNIFK